MAKSTKQSQAGKSKQKSSGLSQAADNAGSIGGNANSAIETLKQDHRRVESLFDQFEQSEDDHEKEHLVERICAELIIHTRLEEELFYPACRDADVDDDIMDEAQVEHDGAKVLINDLLESGADAPYWEAKVSVLKEIIKHHVEEEEKSDGVMERAKENGIDDSGLVERLRRRKQDLQERGIGRRPARPISIQLEDLAEMASRADRGDRMREDEGRYGGGRAYESRGAYGRYEERGGERRGSRYEEDYGGRSSGRERREDEDRGRGPGGWFGDSRGHAEASRRGWDERRGSDDDDRSYRRFQRDDDRGHGGWYGDSHAHSEASRRGWPQRR